LPTGSRAHLSSSDINDGVRLRQISCWWLQVVQRSMQFAYAWAAQQLCVVKQSGNQGEAT